MITSREADGHEEITQDLERKLHFLKEQNKIIEEEFNWLNAIDHKLDLEIKNTFESNATNCYLTPEDFIKFEQTANAQQDTFVIVSAPYSSTIDVNIESSSNACFIKIENRKKVKSILLILKEKLKMSSQTIKIKRYVRASN